MRRTTLAAAGALIITFGSGVAVGALGHWLYKTRSVIATVSKSEQYRERYLAEMKSRLDLTPDQVEKLVGILDSTRSLYREVYDKYRPEYQAVHQLQVAQVRRILTSEQQKKYEELLIEREKKHSRPSH
jgi:hypothetical protein